jgi:hypothetical protein
VGDDLDCDLYLKMGDFSSWGYSVGILVYWGCVFTHGSGYGEHPPFFLALENPIACDQISNLNIPHVPLPMGPWDCLYSGATCIITAV